ncbi:hypothetical protein CHS0354_017506 [Potamilus streckersoni]|uniref:Uncharacterized protein n=1 Tax=Potamilus streckersoni TaxID=2493646 RepID=A0AAE0S2Y1_9BIVA|nr:hypothetical protein CHS0354_017506 [Potamilus streckersoni]
MKRTTYTSNVTSTSKDESHHFGLTEEQGIHTEDRIKAYAAHLNSLKMDGYHLSSSYSTIEDDSWTAGIPNAMQESPTSSNSDNSLQYYDENKMKREQKRRPKPKDGTQLFCGVCGDRALGYNFDAITCESCKAFFRRNALKTKVFACSFDGNCKLDPHTRKFCSGCRLKKCFEIGMKKDWILTDDQLAKRRKKNPDGRIKEGRFSDYSESNSPHSSTEVSSMMMDDADEAAANFNFSPMTLKCEPEEEDDFPQPLSEEIQKEIEQLEKEYDAVFSQGYSKEQSSKLTDNPRSANELFNMTDIFIRRLIKFSKHIPEFRQLKQDDQIHLLKGGIMEILVLRSAMGYDMKMNKWKIKDNEIGKEYKLDPHMIQNALGQNMYSEHVRFVTSLHHLTQSNKTVMTLLFVIELFSADRPNIQNKELVSKTQEKFSMWLKAYLESIYSVNEARQLYPKLLVKLLDVRNLGEFSSQLAASLDITKLEPLLIEIFSLQK